MTGVTDPAAAVIVDFPCSICGARVGYKELYPPGVPRAAGRGPEHPARQLDRPWLYVDNGDRGGDRGLTPDDYAQQVTALAREHPGAFLRLYCPRCAAAYCYRHWSVEADGDPPITFGTCPQGHPRVIDMG